ncbi:acyl-CoA dehydrogenase family protein [Pseudonocardia sp. KRD-184]|uniref:Acyl-CoA dehydrogenase family protein n=2 Tax=Pseudonocardia oceani TaxID=2792013 RepID=A0ABS6U269_9PSEU|nr:acyl-CoA dehydrogenase family protein [Pseudonocardia oceani]MBW0095127.1 acyl-CoA dehydrogenase family protein [Pseudonocardia oceani]MBW0107865.1 acyl-CoA dehydrogenase family protein [Pseudonocardia oceani]MBW0119673.1 acyl-CoA dehydrogenase family protein [Pseudonocardia oceani]MBW0126336.1 acyl-CoA dehydrogenase family protein [Pseudonocardia oceani]
MPPTSTTTTATIRLPDAGLPPAAEALRGEVREFLRAERERGTVQGTSDAWLAGFDAGFSGRLGDRGWLGMTWPRRYGGHEQPSLHRFVVIEELLAAGAPVVAHWVTDRQSGPALLRYGTEEQRERLLPEMARGRSFFAIGMSEPDSGSDLASVRTTARRDGAGWRLNGTKVWTSQAHHCDYMITLCRTSPRDDSARHDGLSQFIVDLRSPGLTVSPIRLLDGEHHFNEVLLEDVFVGDDMVLGEIGSGWRQVTSELAFERSGPERFLSTLPLLVALLRVAEPDDRRQAVAIGQLVAQLWTLRRLSVQIAAALDRGEAPDVAAALVKDLGTTLENEIIDVARSVAPVEPSGTAADPFARELARAVLHAPGFTLRGGTNEVLRGIVARGLGLR